MDEDPVSELETKVGALWNRDIGNRGYTTLVSPVKTKPRLGCQSLRLEGFILLAKDGNCDDNTLLFDNEVKARVDLRLARLFTPAHDNKGEEVLIDLNLADDSATLTENNTAP